jgi:hypothetical protein
MPVKMEPVNPGSLAIDCTPMAPAVLDLPRKRRGLIAEQPDVGDVIKEILGNQADWGDLAGITKADFDRFLELNDWIACIDAVLPAVERLAQMLRISRAMHVDERQRRIYGFAESAETRAKSGKLETLLSKYGKTCAYRSAAGLKAAKTRKKNAEEGVQGKAKSRSKRAQPQPQPAPAPIQAQAEAKPPEPGA